MQEQGHDAPRRVAGEPEDRPVEEPGRTGIAGSHATRLGNVILRGATVLLDLLAWWPEAASAGQTCVAVLQVRQETERK